MWREVETRTATLWLNIVAHSERVYGFSVTHSTGGILVPGDKVQIPASTYENLMQALRRLTDPCRAARPEAFAQLGHLLFRLVLPERIQQVLLQHVGPVVFATEELSLPWELLHDGRQFLCLTRSFSRQPNGDQAANLLFGSPPPRPDAAAPSRVLLIADPGGNLPAAADEARELRALLEAGGLTCDLLIGPSECTYLDIMARITQIRYDIIHFSGHACYLGTGDAPTSAIVLADQQLLMAEDIRRGLVGDPVVFLNACHTTPVDARSDDVQQIGPRIVRTLAQAFTIGNRAGRARAIIGSMWWIDDAAARGVAGRFYQAVLRRETLGEALRLARTEVAATEADPALWSSYVLFGDPLLAFESSTRAVAPEPPKTETAATPDGPAASLRELLAEGVPWSDEARVALVGALATMAAMHWSFFSTIHLLIGLTYLEQGLLTRAVQRRRLDPATARRELRKSLARQSEKQADLVIGENLKTILVNAKRIAAARGDEEASECHLLEAILNAPQSGAVLLLKALQIDLAALRNELAADAPVSPDVPETPASPEAPPTDTLAAAKDIVAPDGALDRRLFEVELLGALDEAAALASRTHWADIRSPHIFLGILTRPDSRLAAHLTAGGTVDPTALAAVLIRALTGPPNPALPRPRLHREFLSENALHILRAGKLHAERRGAARSAESDVLRAILGDGANIITASLAQAGLSPQQFLWPAAGEP